MSAQIKTIRQKIQIEATALTVPVSAETALTARSAPWRNCLAIIATAPSPNQRLAQSMRGASPAALTLAI